MGDGIALLNPLIAPLRDQRLAPGQHAADGTATLVIAGFGFVIGQAKEHSVGFVEHGAPLSKSAWPEKRLLAGRMSQIFFPMDQVLADLPVATPATQLLRALVRLSGAKAVRTGGRLFEGGARDRVGQCLAMVCPASPEAVAGHCQLRVETAVAIVPNGEDARIVGEPRHWAACRVLAPTPRTNPIEDLNEDNMTCVAETAACPPRRRHALFRACAQSRSSQII